MGEDKQTLFNCDKQKIYRIPFNENIKPIIKLQILENLGHNAIKTKCCDCGTVDTYAKDELEKCIVYLCKSCGKKSLYKGKFSNFEILGIVNKENQENTQVKTKCMDCKNENIYSLEDIVSGKPIVCKHCRCGVYEGRKIGKYQCMKIGRKDGKLLSIVKCLECGTSEVVGIEKAVEALAKRTDAIKCKCNTKVVQPIKETQHKQMVPKKVVTIKETEFYKNIKPHNTKSNAVLATCKSCGIQKEYTIKEIENDEPCKICKGLLTGDVICKRKINHENILSKPFTKEAKAKIENTNYFQLVVTDMRMLSKDYYEAKQLGIKYKPTIYCRCSNCDNVTDYSGFNLDEDITECKVCNFSIIPGMIVGRKESLTERIITSISNESNKAVLHMQCTGCNTTLDVLKIDYQSIAIKSCPVCEFQRSNKVNQEKSLVGHIFGASGASDINGYTKVGKYIILKQRYDKGECITKAQCCECGHVVNHKAQDTTGFLEDYKDNQCTVCDSLLCGRKNYIENNNWVGYIKNCRIIEEVFREDGVKKAVVRCLLCNEKKTVPLTLFLYSDYCICENCMEKEIIMRCPSCKNVHKNNIKLRELYSDDADPLINKRIICPVTNKKIDISAYRQYQEDQTRQDYIFENYSELGEIQRVPGNSGLIRCFGKYYVGTNGRKYYTCYCEKHNKFMTLLEDEMEGYNHIYCADTRMYGYI